MTHRGLKAVCVIIPFRLISYLTTGSCILDIVETMPDVKVVHLRGREKKKQKKKTCF